MYLMTRKIKAMGIKMVLSGEGADELFGGYLYFHMAPDAKEFHEETVRKVMGLHQFDCARANKSMMAWGIEAHLLTPEQVKEHVPFINDEVILGGFYCPTVSVVDSLETGTVMRKEATERGALQVFANTEVLDIETEDDARPIVRVLATLIRRSRRTMPVAVCARLGCVADDAAPHAARCCHHLTTSTQKTGLLEQKRLLARRMLTSR